MGIWSLAFTKFYLVLVYTEPLTNNKQVVNIMKLIVPIC